MPQRLILCVGFALLLVTSSLQAEPPHAAYIFPAGGQRGTQVEARIGGCYLHEQADLMWEGEGVQAPETIRRMEETVWFEGPLLYPPESSRKEDYPQDYLATLDIAADAAPGARLWRVATSQGVTGGRKFVVGDLPEVVEQEIDGEAIPVSVTLPVTINGRIFPRQDDDLWTFDAPAGRDVTVSAAAASLGSPFEPRLEILGPEGEQITESVGYLGADPTLRFTTPSAGKYQVRILDAAYGGLQDHVYRLTITDGPWIDDVYPLGGRRGGELELQLRGQQLAADSLKVVIPSDAPETFVYNAHHDGRVTPLTFEVGDAPEMLESEPNDAAPGMEVDYEPGSRVALNGRIEKPGDVDLWAFDLSKGEKLDLEVHAARLGSPLDSLLAIRDTEGNELARNDDASGGQPDSRLSFTAKNDGRVYVAVSDRFAQRGATNFAYRLHVGLPPEPDFRIELPSDAITVDRGGELNLQLTVTAKSGFSRPIKIFVEGLPERVTAPEVQLKKIGKRTTLALTADESCPLGLHHVRIVGTTTDDEPAVTTTAVVPAVGREAPCEELILAVAEPTPFTFAAEYAFSFVPRGSVHYKRYKIERNGYEGPLEVQLADRQVRHLQGVRGTKFVVPADADEFDFPIYLPPWMELGRTSRTTLMATGEVTGPDGKRHKVCFTSGVSKEQIICRVSPAKLQVTAPSTLAVKTGATIGAPVTVNRGSSVHGPVTLELIAPEHVTGVSADPVVVPAGQQQAQLTIQFAASPGPLNAPLLLRATCGEGDQRVVGETKIELFEE